MLPKESTPGLFTSFEGLDFSGKSTIASMLAEDLSNRGFDVVITRDPPYALSPWERLQENDERDKIAKISEAFLMLTARLDNHERVIAPRLREGGIVVADRFLDSWLAYQSVRLSRYFGNEELALEFLLELNQKLVSKGLISFPNVTVLVDNDPSVTMQRKVLRPDRTSKYEVLDIQEMVAAQYHRLATIFSDRIKVVDARGRNLQQVYDLASEIVLGQVQSLSLDKESS